MKLAVIDLDGTLTDTSEVDTTSFLQALAEEFGMRDLSDDWADYPHATDSGIAEEIFRQRHKRKPTGDELARFRRRFVALLRDRSQGCRLIPGADRFLAALADGTEWRGVIATGSWSDSARAKIAACRLKPDLPLFSCDDCIARTEIVRNAITGAQEAYGVRQFSRIVLVGDGVWDVRTARELSRPFVGIGRDQNARRLREEGAGYVFPDYQDLDAVFRAMEQAAAP